MGFGNEALDLAGFVLVIRTLGIAKEFGIDSFSEGGQGIWRQINEKIKTLHRLDYDGWLVCCIRKKVSCEILGSKTALAAVTK